MTQKDIRNLFSTDEAFEDFEKKFNQSAQVRNLRNLITNSQRAFRIVQAQQLQQKLYKIEYETAKSLLDEARKKEEKLNIFKTNIREEDIEKILHLGLCLDVICDCAETYLMDIGDISLMLLAYIVLASLISISFCKFKKYLSLRPKYLPSLIEVSAVIFLLS